MRSKGSSVGAPRPLNSDGELRLSSIRKTFQRSSTPNPRALRHDHRRGDSRWSCAANSQATLGSVRAALIGEPEGELSPSLKEILPTRTTPLDAPPVPGAPYLSCVDSDGVEDDPRSPADYQALPPAERAALHDARRAELVARSAKSLPRWTTATRWACTSCGGLRRQGEGRRGPRVGSRAVVALHRGRQHRDGLGGPGRGGRGDPPRGQGRLGGPGSAARNSVASRQPHWPTQAPPTRPAP